MGLPSGAGAARGGPARYHARPLYAPPACRPTMIDISTQRNTLKDLSARVVALRGYL